MATGLATGVFTGAVAGGFVLATGVFTGSGGGGFFAAVLGAEKAADQGGAFFQPAGSYGSFFFELGSFGGGTFGGIFSLLVGTFLLFFKFFPIIGFDVRLGLGDGHIYKTIMVFIGGTLYFSC